MTCRKNGHVFHKETNSPKDLSVCDECGGELYQRLDDTDKVIQHRLEVYHAQTAPLISYYRNQKLLIDIEGESTPEVVFKRLLEVF